MALSRNISINQDDESATHDLESIRSASQLKIGRTRRVLEYLIFELIEILPEICNQLSNKIKKNEAADMEFDAEMKS